jgi:hypothetical protein
MKNLELQTLTATELLEINGGGDGNNFWYDIGYAIGTSVVVNGNAMLIAALHNKNSLK